MRWPATIVFDLDGTLVDSAPDLTAALNVALHHVGRPAVDPATVRHLVGHGARALIGKGLALSGGGGEAEIDHAFPVFIDYYTAHIADGTRPYPGCEAALDRLSARGATLAICTNKPVALSCALIAALGWSGRFAANFGSDSLPVRKPDPAHLLGTIAAAGGRPASTVFVGDTAVDVATGKAADVPVIACAFGFADRPAGELGADAVIADFAGLDAAMVALGAGLSR